MIFDWFWKRKKDSSPTIFQTNAGQFFPNKSARIGIFIALFLIVLTLVAPFVLPDNPNEQNIEIKLSAPDLRHLLGTDQYGRDVLARTADGGKRSLGAAFATVTLILFLSLILGIVVGAIGGVLDAIAMRIVDVFLALPHLVLALAIVGVLGGVFENLLLALVGSLLAFYMRLVRGYTRLTMNRQDIIVARLAGISQIRIVAGHIFPHVFAQIMILATLDLGGIIVYGREENIMRAVSNINLEVRSGEIVGIYGNPGCGKSTLLRLLATIETPSSGEVFLGGERAASGATKKY